MSRLSTEQQELQASIKKSATIWGVIVGLITAGLVYWILGSQGSGIRMGAAALGGIVVAYAMYQKSFKSGSKSAQCEKCSAAFSITRTDSAETLASSEKLDKREEQDDGTIKVTTWTEEKYDVVDTYTCASCSDATTKEYQTTRRKDEEEVIEPAPKKPALKSNEKPATSLKSGAASPKEGLETSSAKTSGSSTKGGSASSTKGGKGSSSKSGDK